MRPGKLYNDGKPRRKRVERRPVLHRRKIKIDYSYLVFDWECSMRLQNLDVKYLRSRTLKYERRNKFIMSEAEYDQMILDLIWHAEYMRRIAPVYYDAHDYLRGIKTEIKMKSSVQDRRDDKIICIPRVDRYAECTINNQSHDCVAAVDVVSDTGVLYHHCSRCDQLRLLSDFDCLVSYFYKTGRNPACRWCQQSSRYRNLHDKKLKDAQ